MDRFLVRFIGLKLGLGPKDWKLFLSFSILELVQARTSIPEVSGAENLTGHSIFHKVGNFVERFEGPRRGL